MSNSKRGKHAPLVYIRRYSAGWLMGITGEQVGWLLDLDAAYIQVQQ